MASLSLTLSAAFVDRAAQMLRFFDKVFDEVSDKVFPEHSPGT